MRLHVRAWLWSVALIARSPHTTRQQATALKTLAKKIRPQASDEKIAFYTEALAWFTGISAVVSGVPGFFLYRADKIARTSADAAKLAAEAAQKSVDALPNIERVYLFYAHAFGETDRTAAEAIDAAMTAQR